MHELSERDKAKIIDGIPETDLALFCPGLQGRGGTLIDRSTYAGHGTIVSATWQNLPRGLASLSFDGSTSYVNFGNWVRLDGAKACTFSVWFYLDTIPTDGALIRRWRAGQWAFILGVRSTGIVRLAVGSSTGKVLTKDTSAILSTGSWYHAAGIWSGGNTANVVVSGVDQVLTAIAEENPSNIASVAEYLCLGSRWNNGVPDSFVDGLIALPVIYSRALSVTEAIRLYNRQRHLFGV